jgi:hypothetical protein
VAALGGVVVDHVQNHLDTGVVHDLDERLDLADAAFAEILRVRREEADGVVAPVVAQTPLDQVPVVDEGMHR